MQSGRRSRMQRKNLPYIVIGALIIGLVWLTISSVSPSSSAAGNLRRRVKGLSSPGTTTGSGEGGAQLVVSSRTQQEEEENALFAHNGKHNPQEKYLPIISPGLADTKVDHLIVVAGHAIYKGADLSQWPNEDNWVLEPFQKGFDGLFVQTLVRHMQVGMSALLGGFERSLLMFSGGQTRAGAGPRSEGQTYYQLTEAQLFFQAEPNEDRLQEIANHVYAEEHSRDSYENILFSVCRFYELTGHYPGLITVVGFEYKRKRFTDYHRAAIRWPSDRFRYLGVDMSDVAKDLGITITDERKANPNDDKSLATVAGDMYLCRENLETRRHRNPYRNIVPYAISNPQLRELLNYCGPNLFQGPLPWDSLPKDDVSHPPALLPADDATTNTGTGTRDTAAQFQ